MLRGEKSPSSGRKGEYFVKRTVFERFGWTSPSGPFARLN